MLLSFSCVALLYCSKPMQLKGKRDVLFSFKINYKLKGIGVNVQAVARPGEKLVVGHLVVVGAVECCG